MPNAQALPNPNAFAGAPSNGTTSAPSIPAMLLNVGQSMFPIDSPINPDASAAAMQTFALFCLQQCQSQSPAGCSGTSEATTIPSSLLPLLAATPPNLMPAIFAGGMLGNFPLLNNNVESNLRLGGLDQSNNTDSKVEDNGSDLVGGNIITPNTLNGSVNSCSASSVPEIISSSSIIPANMPSTSVSGENNDGSGSEASLLSAMSSSSSRGSSSAKSSGGGGGGNRTTKKAADEGSWRTPRRSTTSAFDALKFGRMEFVD